MKSYPSIPSIKELKEFGKKCIGFEKLDGSNIRYQFSFKTGWKQCGTRTRLFDKSDPIFGCAIDLFKNTLASTLENRIKKYKQYQQVIFYCEFFGPNTFSGQHDIETLRYLGFDVQHNEPKQLVLIDVNLHKKGFLGPQQFVDEFGDIGAKVVYTGPLNEEFIEDVRQGKYPVREGVVCKWGENHDIHRYKIKTNAYLEELKKRFGLEQWEKYA